MHQPRRRRAHRTKLKHKKTAPDWEPFSIRLSFRQRTTSFEAHRPEAVVN